MNNYSGTAKESTRMFGSLLTPAVGQNTSSNHQPNGDTLRPHTYLDNLPAEVIRRSLINRISKPVPFVQESHAAGAK